LSNLKNYFKHNWFEDPKSNILSGIVVAFAMIPEAIAFSGIAGVDPKVGLYGAFCLSISIAIFGGRKGMITSATGSTALLMTGLVTYGESQAPGLGLSYLIAAGLLTGVLQIIWGYMKLAYQMRFVPSGVLSGFVNALALLIFQAQLPQLGIGIKTSDLGIEGISQYPINNQIPIVWILVILGLIIIYGFPKLTKVIPSQLVAIITITSLSSILNLDIPTVSDLGKLPDGLPSLSIPFGALENGKVPFNLSTLGIILPTSLAISLVGLMETFLTQDILDDATDSSSNKNKEARGQGLANITASFFGGMAGCALVGQSVMNNDNGGNSRLSTLTSGLSLLMMIILFKSWIGSIPMAALVAVMITISISTADFNGLKNIRKIPKSDTSVMLTTFAVTMLTKPHNLALGVIAGVALAAILFSRKVAKVITVSKKRKDKDSITYVVEGQLFFVSKMYFFQGFDIYEHPNEIFIDMTAAHIWDQSGVVALDQIIRKFKKGGSKVIVIGLNKESTNLFERLGGLESSH
tara:strand:- start:10188 stop:11753 length:1566 start_codon:yes stop_codon:yes gene_type:complete